jgi:hypothetical protein
VTADQIFPPENYWQDDSARTFVRSHELLIPSQHLRFTMEFEDNAIFIAAQGMVEQRALASNGRRHWQVVPRSSATLHPEQSPEIKGRRATLEVADPVLGRRYGIALSLPASAAADMEAIGLADRVRQICKNERNERAPMMSALTNALMSAIKDELPGRDAGRSPGPARHSSTVNPMRCVKLLSNVPCALNALYTASQRPSWG